MTTTIRPTGPEEPRPDGSRARSFEICVNGRAVGALRLSAAPPGGVPAGRIEELSVDPPDRRRGRATVAVLAAEEVLRGWGCRQVEAWIPPRAEAALALAAALGYRELGRNMVKTPDAAPSPLPPGVEIRPLDDAAYPDWLAAERTAVVRVLTDRDVPAAEAADRADRSFARLLPDGPATAGAVLRQLLRDGEPAGSLWLHTGGELPDRVAAYVFSVEVAARHRGAGLGRELMREAERICLARRLPSLGLHVFAGNEPALGLYSSLGYRTTGLNHLKRLL